MLEPGAARRLEERLRAVEVRTGVQVVVAAIDRADVYHGLRWRAFAIGVAIGAALVALVQALRPGAIPSPAPIWAIVASLGVGLLAALKAMLLPSAARLLLEPMRAEAEVRQHAATLFLGRELFATRGRTAVLLLASAFERLAVVHADSGFRGRVGAGDWRPVELAMGAGGVRAGRIPEGLLAGLDALERLLVDKGFAPVAGAPNELPDRPVCEAGAP